MGLTVPALSTAVYVPSYGLCSWYHTTYLLQQIARQISNSPSLQHVSNLLVIRSGNSDFTQLPCETFLGETGRSARCPPRATTKSGDRVRGLRLHKVMHCCVRVKRYRSVRGWGAPRLMSSERCPISTTAAAQCWHVNLR